jgi:hypothetical protein
VLNLLAGKLELEGEVVKPRFITGESKEQRLEVFIGRIKVVLENK